MTPLLSWLRAFLALSRAARLPTVWSNCLAGWWLGDGGDSPGLPFVLAGASCLYLGGAFLNDAFDADYDRQHRPVRPIPAGVVAQATVWRWGLGLLMAGALLLFWPGTATGSLGLALVVSIILYNTVHKAVALAPAVLGLCRFFLYLLGAVSALHGITGTALWCGLALAVFVTGLGCFLRWEKLGGEPRYWPTLLLGAPILLALLLNADGCRESALLLSAVLVLSVLRSLRYSFWSAERSLPTTVSGLVASIVVVDWLAAANAPQSVSLMFLGLWAATFIAQRLAPEN
jgi:hypothetical protein